MAEVTKPTSTTNPEFDRLLQVAEQLVSQKQLNPSLLISLGGTLAAEVNKVAGLRGSEKQRLVCDVVKQVVKKSVEATTDVSGAALKLEPLLFVVDSVLPASLDLAVAAARGKFDLKKTKKTCFSLLMACLPSALGACGASSPQIQLVLEQVEKAAGPELTQTDESPAIQKAVSSRRASSHTESPQLPSNDKEVVEPREVVATLPSNSQIV